MFARTSLWETDPVLRVRTLAISDVELIASIDRSEHVEREYHVVNGKLAERPVTMAEVPPWTSVDGPHSAASKIEFCQDRIGRGGELFGVFDGDTIAGVAVVEPHFDPPTAWLSFLHVSRPFRRCGAASALWRAAVDRAVAASAESLYVSATPTGSAVGFYLAQGCVLADPPRSDLFEEEPDDIHLVLPLTSS
jgi:ribosomal protein S18 acetylase RimI-like enzyme